MEKPLATIVPHELDTKTTYTRLRLSTGMPLVSKFDAILRYQVISVLAQVMPPRLQQNTAPARPAAAEPGALSNQSVNIHRDKIPRDVLPTLSPGTRTVEVHVGDKLPFPSRSYNCKTNGGHAFVLSGELINSCLNRGSAAARAAPARVPARLPVYADHSETETDSDSEHRDSEDSEDSTRTFLD